MRLAVKKTHAVVSARLAALANVTSLDTASALILSTFAKAQTVRVSPTVFLGKSIAINLKAKPSSTNASSSSVKD